MKIPFFSRLFRSKAGKKNTDRPSATPEDIRKKLEHYKRKEGPASFSNAGVYNVSEVDDESINSKTLAEEAAED